MGRSKNEHEASVNDDLTEVVRTGDIFKQGASGDGVSLGVSHLQLSKDLVGLKLEIPCGQEDEGEEPALWRQ